MHWICALTLCAVLQLPVPESIEDDRSAMLDVHALQVRLKETNSVDDRLAALALISSASTHKDAFVYVPLVQGCLEHRDSDIQVKALDTLANLAFHHSVRCPNRALELLFAEDEKVRDAACSACSVFQTFADDGLPLLLQALKSPNADIRGQVPMSLKYFAYRLPEATAALHEAAGHEDISVRNNACVALWHLTGDLDFVVPHWLECLAAQATGQPLRGVPASNQTRVEFYAVAAASMCHTLTESHPRELGTALGKQLRHKSPAIRGRAAHILGAMARNDEAERALRQLGMHRRLQQLLKDADEGVQASASLALQSFDQE